MSLSIDILLSLNVLDLLEAETLQPTGGPNGVKTTISAKKSPESRMRSGGGLDHLGLNNEAQKGAPPAPKTAISKMRYHHVGALLWRQNDIIHLYTPVR